MDLSDFYHDIILDHIKSPKNKRVMDPIDRKADGHNPLCGDRVTVYLMLDGDTIQDICFDGEACGYCTASSSMLTQQVKGKTLAEASKLGELFVDALANQKDGDPTDAALEDLEPLFSIRKIPMRVKCATLPWHTLQAAIDDNDEAAVKTE